MKSKATSVGLFVSLALLALELVLSTKTDEIDRSLSVENVSELHMRPRSGTYVAWHKMGNVSEAPDDITLVSSTAQTQYMENIIPLMLNKALPGKVVEDWQCYFDEHPNLKAGGLARTKEAMETHYREFGKAEGCHWGCMSAQVAKDPTQQDGASCFGSEDPSMIIISLVVNFPGDYVEALRKNRLMVANAANYRYCQYSHALASDRDIAWSKVIAIRHLLDIQQKPVVWMDADAIFTSVKKFEDVTDVHFQTDQKDIVFTDDKAPGPDSINTGVLVTRSTAWTKKFWASVYKDFPEAISHMWWEQQAVILYKQKFAQDFAAHTAIVPHAVMNNVGQFGGQFVAHPAGGHSAGKYQRLLEVMRG